MSKVSLCRNKIKSSNSSTINKKATTTTTGTAAAKKAHLSIWDSTPILC